MVRERNEEGFGIAAGDPYGEEYECAGCGEKFTRRNTNPVTSGPATGPHGVMEEPRMYHSMGCYEEHDGGGPPT